MRIELTRDAEHDLADAFDWYVAHPAWRKLQTPGGSV
jgi:hypothetical protein